MSDSLIDVSARILSAYQMEKDEELIALVTEALLNELSKQSDIIRYCNDSTGLVSTE